MCVNASARWSNLGAHPFAMTDKKQNLVQAIHRQFAFLKEANGLEALFARNIALPTSGGALVPVAELHRTDAGLNTLMPVADWLTDPGRLAVLVLNRQMQPLGALGLLCHDDLSLGLTRIVGDAGDQVMVEAAGVLAKWAEDSLFIEKVTVPDGEAAFWEAAGFCKGIFRAPQARTAGESLILTAGPSISAREAAYAFDAAKYGWNKEWSKYLTKFEQDFAAFVDASHAMACSSGTGALTIALTALDIGPGDEVIVPDLTWVATANAVRYVGATPIFADIELDTWNIDAGSAEALITPRTKAIMPVHMYGHPARMDRVLAVARKHGLYVIEDAAPAIGAEWQGRRCGSFGDFAAFSFQGAKLLVTGEGGMLVCNNPKLYEKALKVWDQGRNPNKTFWIDSHGLKYKMANVQAAIGLGQLERCAELVAMKRRVFDWYAEGLQGVPDIHLNHEAEGAHSIYWMSSLRLEEGARLTRDELGVELKKRNVDSRPVFPAISQYPIWGREVAPQPTALRVGRQAMNLPSGVCLRREQVDYVCRQIREILGA